MFWEHFFRLVKKHAMLFLLIPLICGFGATLIARHEFTSSDPSQNSYYGYKQSILASLGAYAPYAFMEKGGMLDGYIIQLTRAIGREMRARIDIVSRKLDDTQESAIIRDVDVVLCMVQTERTRQYFDFTKPYAINTFTLVKRKGATAPSDYHNAINAGRFVFNTDGAYYELNHEKISNAGLAPTAEDALRMIDSGQYDYTVLENYTAQRIVGMMYLENVEIAGDTDEIVEYSFAVRKGNPELLDIFKRGMVKLQNTGQFSKIQSRWVEKRFLISQSSRNVIMSSIMIGVGISLFVLLLFFVWTVMLQEEVGIRTAELSSEIEVRKKTEAQLLANQAQLIQADKLAAIGTLASGIAHEINNPNGLLLLNISFMKRLSCDLLNKLDEKKQDEEEELAGIPYSMLKEHLPNLLNDMEVASTRIGEIVEDLKDFSRSDDKEWREYFSVNDSVRAALRLLEHNLRKSTSNLEIKLTPGLPKIYGSIQKIEQVVINLILNASQSIDDPSKRISVSTSWNPDRKEVSISVEDEGCGIPKENLPVLRDPFFTTKRDTGGTGLGLSISDTIVKSHRGQLDITSKVGKGTKVTLYLPVLDEAELKDDNEKLS
ncbi:ATP-binding protein [uncultured Cohaesibacter sp.]|uniref:ATP-binding protein n=1 Tax=uncultured Cohaesibacter sp. TaxID=1002546 RepID=UPI00292E3933|nr:transporter substrate-binding domain-containing protein [uncultured Cohaesibacter sp.]